MHRRGRKSTCFGRHRFVSFPLPSILSALLLPLSSSSTLVRPRRGTAARPPEHPSSTALKMLGTPGSISFLPRQKERAVQNAFCFSRSALDRLEKQLPPSMAGACLTLMRYFCIAAQYHAGKCYGHDLRRGQLFAGRLSIKSQTGLSEKTIRSAIKTLKNAGEVASRVARRGTIYTIVNYESYDAISRKETDEEDGSGPAGGHIQRSTKKEKKIPMESPGSVPPENQSQKQPEKPAPKFQSPPKKIRQEDYKDLKDYYAAVREDNRRVLLQLSKGSQNHPDTPFIRGK